MYIGVGIFNVILGFMPDKFISYTAGISICWSGVRRNLHQKEIDNYESKKIPVRSTLERT